ncbi:MAG: N-acetylmuramoyl-L-alanine amidase, partial [Gemmatimonadales bacterium]|nr:N-acetylmuramoyl-L-alanine amidase [Gemmatimonadales bacterium]
MVFARRPGLLALLPGLWACARPAAPPPARPAAAVGADSALRDSTRLSSALPEVPPVRGRLAIRVVYPPPDAEVRAQDSSFLLGSVGTGDARLTINGHPVRVWPNGAWLAWIPLPPDSLMRFRIAARTATDSAVMDYSVTRAGWRPAPGPELWLDSASLAPRGRVWWPAGEYLTLSARASEGAELRLRLPDGTVIPLFPESRLEQIPEAIRAFDRDTAKLVSPVRRDRYVGVLRGRSVGPSPGPLLPSPWTAPVFEEPVPDSVAWGVVEAIRGADTVRARWPLQVRLLDTLPLIAELDDDTTGGGITDGITVGRAVPGGTYHWFFPTGTRARVSGRLNDDLRLRLAPESEAWIAASEARAVPGLTAVPAVVGSVRLTPLPDRVRMRVPLSHRVPFKVTESERTLTLRLYGALGDVNWIQYGAHDSLIRRVTWSQDDRSEVTLTLDLARRVWGYHARWERGDLILDVRRSPALDQAGSLKGRLIAVDPGHPPGGATGPTGLREAQANRAIGLELKRLLEQEGARVFITRTADVPLELWPRMDAAERAGADLLISIHNNALPDGVNPLTNNGTSVYYNQPRSVSLA